MSRRTPIFATIIVIAAAITMIALGVWQLGRAEEKADLLARFETARLASEEAAFPAGGEGEQVWFRRSRVTCVKAVSIEPVAGTAASGQKGWIYRAVCETGASGRPAMIDLGFARALAPPAWTGGNVTGVIAPGPRLVADPPVAGLAPMARPDPADLPNNHLAYAVQWFLFALTALVIYVLALRRRRG